MSGNGPGPLLVAFEWRGEWQPICQTSRLSTAWVFIESFRDLGRVALHFLESETTIEFPARPQPLSKEEFACRVRIETCGSRAFSTRVAGFFA